MFPKPDAKMANGSGKNKDNIAPEKSPDDSANEHLEDGEKGEGESFQQSDDDAGNEEKDPSPSIEITEYDDVEEDEGSKTTTNSGNPRSAKVASPLGFDWGKLFTFVMLIAGLGI